MNQLPARTLRKILSGITLSLFFFICCNSLQAQSLSVFDVDQSAFPTIKAKFHAFDKDGRQVTNLSPSDFTVKEDGVARKVTFVSCPAAKPPLALSSVLVIDVSGSMAGSRIQSAKDAANVWVDGLPAGNSECALTSFSFYSVLLSDFTKDRQKLKNSIDGLVPTAGTNYNQALIEAPAGGLLIAKTGKYKRVLIFLTDGAPDSDPRTQQIIDFAKQNDITIYAAILDMVAPQCVKDMTLATGGLNFENIKTKKDAEDTYRKILVLAQGGEPCSIEWQSPIRCQSNTIDVEADCLGAKANFSYVSTPGTISNLVFNPVGVRCWNKPPGVAFDTTFTVTAINSDFNVTDITSGNPLFDITPKSFSLTKGQTKTLNLRFTPADSSYQIATFRVENDLCQKSYYAGGGFKIQKLSQNTLRLIQPNGGEEFVVGSDTVITWAGVLPSDTVRLEFSTDNGISWRLITYEATGLSYIWKNIPKPPSSRCLIRVSTNIGKSYTSPQIEWQKCFGGYYIEDAYRIIETNDGGFVVAGSASSNDGDISGLHGNGDVWIFKIDPSGVLLWQKCLGGTNYDFASSIIQTSDGGFIVSGYTNSNDGDVSGYRGSDDYWIVKLDAAGALLWQKFLGGSNTDYGSTIIETSDGGLIVVGSTRSNDGDVFGYHGGTEDGWIVKLSQTGVLQWQKCLGGSDQDIATTIIETSDGSFMVAGYTTSNDGDVSGNNGLIDRWVVKLSQTGELLWQKCLGGSGNDYSGSIIETSDGGFIVSGNTISNNGDVSGNHGAFDYWIVKLNQTGELQWQKCLGGSYSELGGSAVRTIDGGFIASSTTVSMDGDVSGNHGVSDYWVIKLSPDGEIQWQKCLGGGVDDFAGAIIQTSDFGYIVTGSTASYNGDVSGNHGNWDIWVVKLSLDGIAQTDVSDTVFSIVMPQPSSTDIDMKQCLLGSTKDSVVTGFISNTGTFKCQIDSIYFIGADATAFSLVSGQPPYVVAAGSSHPAEFHFVPNRIGVHQAQIVVVTQSGNLIQNIRGEGVQPLISVVDDIIDFGAVRVGDVKDSLKALTIKNVGPFSVDIISTIHIGPNNRDFSTLSGSAPFTLQPGETAKMDLRFTPTEIGRTNGQIEFNFNGPGSPAVVRLFGQGLGGSVVISSDSAYAGKTKRLRLTLGGNSKPVPQMLATKFRVRLGYNKTLLSMKEKSAIKTWNDSNEFAEITSGWDGSTSTLGEFKVRAAIGNAETTDIIIEEFNWLNDKSEAVDFETETTNGTFKILGICRDGGSRLVNPDGNEMIKSIYPNPSKDELVINYELTESGFSRLYLTNILGERVMDIMNDDKPALGEQSINININDLCSGTYYVILETMNGCQSRRVEVVR